MTLLSVHSGTVDGAMMFLNPAGLQASGKRASEEAVTKRYSAWHANNTCARVTAILSLSSRGDGRSVWNERGGASESQWQSTKQSPQVRQVAKSLGVMLKLSAAVREAQTQINPGELQRRLRNSGQRLQLAG
jgi:hypothetical protein